MNFKKILICATLFTMLCLSIGFVSASPHTSIAHVDNNIALSNSISSDDIGVDEIDDNSYIDEDYEDDIDEDYEDDYEEDYEDDIDEDYEDDYEEDYEDDIDEDLITSAFDGDYDNWYSDVENDNNSEFKSYITSSYISKPKYHVLTGCYDGNIIGKSFKTAKAFDSPMPKKNIKTYKNLKKVSTKVYAPVVTKKYNKKRYFKVLVNNKANNKHVKNLKLKVKVYTGKKHKVYTIKTNSKGIAKLNIKKLSKGKHLVVIGSGNKHYKVYKTSFIKIKR